MLGLLLLAACDTVRPLHAPALGGDALNEELAKVIVATATTRRSQVLRNELIDQLDPAGLRLAPEYRLSFRLRRELTDLAVQLDDSVTRRDLTLTAIAQLADMDTGDVVYRTAVTRVASFNILGDPFATLVAEQDAERRASVEIASQLRTLIALYFERDIRSPPI